MLSRVANSICWMARYMERSHGVLRMLRTNYIFSQEEVREFNWRSVLRLYSSLTEEKIIEIETKTPDVLEHLVLDNQNVSSVCNNIYRARENARAVQDHITKEVWQCLNEYFHLMRDTNLFTQLKSQDPITAFDTLVRQGLLYHGTVDITMARDEGFTYLNIGKYLERAILSVDMLYIKLFELKQSSQKDEESGIWRYLLYSLSGYELYIKTYRGKLETINVLNQVLYNPTFPHSILYCLEHITSNFERLKEESDPEDYAAVEYLAGKAISTVKYTDPDFADETAVMKYLRDIRIELFKLSEGLDQHFFSNS